MFTVGDEIRLIQRQITAVLAFRTQLEALMTDANANLTALNEELAAAAARVDADVQGLLAKINSLQTASQADKDELRAYADGIAASVQTLRGGFDPVQDAPTDPVDPTDPDEPVEPPPFG